MAITYVRETDLPEAEYVDVVAETTMRTRRPLGNRARIRAMLEGANFVVTARDDGRLVGLARCISDEAWICYCAELAVRESYQGRGVGRGLVEACVALLGPRIGFTLVAEPTAEAFYERIGMQRYTAFFIPRSDAS